MYIRAIKTRLDLNETQHQMLLQYGGLSRFIYNWGLKERVEHYKQTKKTLSYPKQNLALTGLKKENDWMYDCSKWVGQEALRNLDKAFTVYFKSLKQPSNKRRKNKKYTQNQIDFRQHVSRFPKFKKKSANQDKFSFPAYSGDTTLVKVTGTDIKLPKLGTLKTHENLEKKIKGKLIQATISQDGKYWDISLSFEVEENPIENLGVAVGIDLGIKTFATLSDGSVVENPKFYRGVQDKLKREQRWLSRKIKGSVNRKKAIQRVQDVNRDVRTKRQDFLHKLSTELTRNYSVICLEDLNVSGMLSNHKLAKSIWDAGFYEFRRQLEYKAKSNGSEIRLISRWFPSSKTCNSCGTVNENLRLKDRRWDCSCGRSLDRDLNAALNILTVGLAA